MKILITGTAGFIGFHLANRLVKDGHDVYGLDSINDYYDVNLKHSRLALAGFEGDRTNYNELIQSSKHPNSFFINLGLEDKENLNAFFKDQAFDAVCNLAAQAGVRYSLTNPSAYISANIEGFLNILESCRNFGVTNLSYASSSSVYGLNRDYPFSEDKNADHPVSLYGATKKANELMAHSYSSLYGISTTGLRFFTVYGPWGRPDMALFLFTKAILEGKPIDIFNNGDMVRDFTYVADIVEGVRSVILHPAQSNVEWDPATHVTSSSSAPFRVYNIGNNSPVRLTSFIDAIENSLGIVAKKNYLPMQLGDVQATHADSTNLVNDFNFNPSTPIQSGIDNFIDWYKSYYLNSD
jgi:UDP-glucuronate 4-epimerase